MQELMKTMDENTKEAFKILSELYKMPEFKQKEDALKFIESYNVALKDYYKEDVIDACLTIFKWNKSEKFPTPSHLLSELINKQKVYKPYSGAKPLNIPEEIKDVYNEALIFFGVCSKCYAIRFKDEIYKIYRKLAIPFAFELRTMLDNAYEGFAKLNKLIYEDEIFNYVYAFKNHAFDDLQAKIKENMIYSGE